CTQEVGRAEREAAGSAEPPVQGFELDRRVLERGDEEERALLVAQEEVLGVATRNLAAQRLRLPDREEGRMRHGAVRDTELIEQREQVGGGGGHRRLALLDSRP